MLLPASGSRWTDVSCGAQSPTCKRQAGVTAMFPAVVFVLMVLAAE